MKVSIITVVLNNADCIADAIESVLSQKLEGAELEYIIVDGGSTDNTPEIIKSYGSRITRTITGKDKGIYHAMNKGLQAATGDIIGILNSVDFYTGPHVLAKVLEVFKSTNADTVYGDLKYVHPQDTDRTLRYWRSGIYRPGSFKLGWMPPHPTFFVKKHLYEKHGYFDTEFTSAADYELMLRMLHKHNASAGYVPEVLVKMRAGGKSNKQISNRLHANREDRRAWQKNGLRLPFYTGWLKPLRKLPQFLRRGK
ncbi:MAG: glycosyltransferase family 2 protein [Bacteroidota bacterium]